MNKPTLSIKGIKLTSDMLRELLSVMENQETTDADINTSIILTGEYGTYTMKFDKEGNVKLNACERI